MDNIDLRFKQSQDFINKGIGKPVYKRRAFSHINKILGPQYKWINKTPEEYFYGEENKLSQEEKEVQELQRAADILQFRGGTTFSNIKQTYKNLSRGFSRNNTSSPITNKCGFHPDCGGHDAAFAILNHAYNIFKTINENTI